jgi:hypothetical protein
MAIKTIRIHPAIGIARLGNSADLFIGPEKPGDHTPPAGGYKDADCNLKKQAARFRLFGYDETDTLVGEITLANATTIQWTAHLANTKAASEFFVGPFEPPNPGLRNPTVVDRTQLVIDPGARTITGANQSALFDTGHFMGVEVPLGEMRTDQDGHLLILGGSGSAGSPNNVPLGNDPTPNFFANNNGWYDDVSDGPITCKVTLKDSTSPPVKGAWVICAPPKYAPAVEDIVTLYDTLAAAKGWAIAPAKPSFNKDIFPILDRAIKVQSLFDFSTVGAGNHGSLSSAIPDGPGKAQIAGILRSPGLPLTQPSDNGDMPKIWSDAFFPNPLQQKRTAPLTPIQYANIQNWAAGTFTNDWTGSPPPPETQITPAGLDRAALEACVGAAFFPGIETSWKTRDQYPFVEPFRLDWTQLQPGDLTKQMAIPWQSDFVDCAAGDVAVVNGVQEVLLWWPAHRPLSVFPEDGSPRHDWGDPLATDAKKLIDNFHRLGIVVEKNGKLMETERDVVCKSVVFLVERSTLGQDEIDARRNLPGGPVVKDAFRVVVDGFAAGDIGINSPTSQLKVNSPITGLNINCTGNVSETGSYGPGPQRFTFKYDLDFGPDDKAFNFNGTNVFVPLSVTVNTVSASAELELIKQPDPFILHGDPSWLSVDLRVFAMREGESKFGRTLGSDGAAARSFIQNVIKDLTTGKGVAGGQSFDNDLKQGQFESTLFVYPNEMGSAGKKVFNFAIAKVHYIGAIGADNVRVFFRMFSAQSTSTVYDQNTTYARQVNPHGHPIAVAGIKSSEYVTIPFFAEKRVDTTVKSMDQQTDDPYNVQKIVPGPGGAEVDYFFGCWIDINQPFQDDGVTPNNVLPVNIPASNVLGPFQDAQNPPLPIQQAILRHHHQCIVAEIAFDPIPIPGGKDPSNWDKLAQRNLAWSDIPNPAIDARHALNTFEMRPTSRGLAKDQTPDELMIDWGNVPHGTEVQIYLPAVKSQDIMTMANLMYSTHRLQRFDDFTIKCRTGGITYVPIPAGGPSDYAGLMSIALPSTVRKGESFTVVVNQVTNTYRKAIPAPTFETARLSRVRRQAIGWRKVLGTFQINIPVKTKDVLLAPEERLYSVLLWIFQAIPVTNRWYPVFRRYLDQIANRVRGLGGNPGEIKPSPTGDGNPHGHGKGDGEEGRLASTGKIVDLLFDGFGDFEGFVLDTEDGKRRFASREKDLSELATRAWRERLRITVLVEKDSPHQPLAIIIHEPPAIFES